MAYPVFVILLVVAAFNAFPLLLINKRKLLTRRFEYYRNLNDNDKKEFLSRINIILKSKSFVGKDSTNVTPQMKVMVAATFVQLTFGFSKYLLPHYKLVYIYPDAYLNRHTNKLHKGETNTNGFIKISWNHFVDGYKTCNDRLNLGLHEVSHALLNTIIYSNDHDPDLDEDLLALDTIPDEERNRLFSGDDPFFRDYACRNIKEFFAVAIECFFEMPEKFREQFPCFYKLMCDLLNQDPAGKKFRGLS